MIVRDEKICEKLSFQEKTVCSLFFFVVACEIRLCWLSLRRVV